MVHFVGGDSKISSSHYYAIVAPDEQKGPLLRLVVVPIGPDNQARPTGNIVCDEYWSFITDYLNDEGASLREAVKHINFDRFMMLTTGGTKPPCANVG